MKRLMLLFAALGVAIAIVGLVMAGDELLIENQRADAQTATRPNFVFVMTDDLDERSMEQLHGIQKIMGDHGTTFKNAFVTYSLCCPSRATFLRGQYPHNHGVTSDKSTEGGAEVSPTQARRVHDGYLAQRCRLPDKVPRQVHERLPGPYVPPGLGRVVRSSRSVDGQCR